MPGSTNGISSCRPADRWLLGDRWGEWVAEQLMLAARFELLGCPDLAVLQRRIAAWYEALA